MKIKRIALIGVGLIGGSLGMALKQDRKFAGTVVGVGRNQEKLKLARSLGAVDEITTDIRRGVEKVELVVVTTPVETIAPLVKRILPCIRPQTVITDAGSIKAPVVESVESLTPRPLFVGSHPLAGSEKSGVRHARKDLFKDAVCVVTPTVRTDREALFLVTRLWRNVGCRVVELSPCQHDQWVAVSSHLPHVLASSLVEITARLARKDKRVKQVLAASFMDLSRVASSDPELWSQILLGNREAVLRGIRLFQREVASFARILKEGKGRRVKARLRRGKMFRYSLLREKEDVQR